MENKPLKQVFVGVFVLELFILNIAIYIFDNFESFIEGFKSGWNMY